MAAMAFLPVTSGTIFIPSSPARTTLPLPVAKRGQTKAWKDHALDKKLFDNDQTQ